MRDGSEGTFGASTLGTRGARALGTGAGTVTPCGLVGDGAAVPSGLGCVWGTGGGIAACCPAFVVIVAGEDVALVTRLTVFMTVVADCWMGAGAMVGAGIGASTCATVATEGGIRGASAGAAWAAAGSAKRERKSTPLPRPMSRRARLAPGKLVVVCPVLTTVGDVGTRCTGEITPHAQISA